MNETVETAYRNAQATTQDLMARLHAALAKHHPCFVNWGHVGDLMAVNQTLSEILEIVE